MNTTRKRSPLSAIPGYSQNAVLQLIVASATGFITYHLIRVILLVVGLSEGYFATHFTPYVALPSIQQFGTKFWTVFTYGWTHDGFWVLFTNMVWLYAFGAVMQSLVGYKQVIPLFVYSLIVGGLFYECSQLLPVVSTAGYMVGAHAGVVGVATAILTLSPNYRFYLAPTFSIPIVVLAIIFYALMLVNINMHTPSLFMIAGGALTGFTYMMLLKNGKQPGMWIYNMFDRLSDMAEPDADKLREKNSRKRNEALSAYQARQNNQQRIDDILDKINRKGYNSLTQEEKDILIKASKDNNA
ncbi:hypothetical protein CAP35_02400 [Chitinophagaceae bacterium IBVUCB1]|nr:hypothetical protein CAP35_02400 [Chitinophagaceae bacterium IBVUCB1]